MNFQDHVIPPGTSQDIYQPTYRAGAVGITLYSTAAAVLLEVIGSATKTIRIKKISMWAQAGTKFFTELEILRCTAASGGTPTAATGQPHDTSDPAATATVNSYAAAATYGTGHLIMGAKGLYVGAPAATNGLGSIEWNFANTGDKNLVLRGTGDVIEIYNTITGLGTGTFGFEVEWVEDNS